MKNLGSSLNESEDAVESEPDAKKEDAEHEVDLERAVARLGVLQQAVAVSIVFVHNFFALDVIDIIRGIVEETIGGVKRGGEASAGRCGAQTGWGQRGWGT